MIGLILINHVTRARNDFHQCHFATEQAVETNHDAKPIRCIFAVFLYCILHDLCHNIMLGRQY